MSTASPNGAKKCVDHLKRCANCDTEEGVEKVCGRCNLAYYCGKPCQVQHWKKGGHKQFCVPLEARHPSLFQGKAASPKKEEECSICLSPIEETELCTLPCSHRFHTGCAGRLRKTTLRQVCPECRADLPPSPEKVLLELNQFKIKYREVGNKFPAKAEAIQDSEAFCAKLEVAAKQGSAEAQHEHGGFLKYVRKNKEKEAFSWFLKSAQQGYGLAEHDVGTCYMEGKGVERDLTLAFSWTLRAAKKGVAKAQFNIGLSYMNGAGVEENDSIGFFWYRKAAQQGIVEAQYNVGVSYFHGFGCRKDERLGNYWMTKAALAGCRRAQLYLAVHNHGNEHF